MHFDGTITAGSVVGALIGALTFISVAVVGWYAFRARTEALMTAQSTLFERLFQNQERLMTHLTERFEEHEAGDREMFEKIQTRLADLAAGVQRLVGQNDAFRIAVDRRREHDR